MTLAANASEYLLDTQAVSRFRGAARVLRVALLLSASAHALLIAAYITQYSEPQKVEDSSPLTFELRLEPGRVLTPPEPMLEEQPPPESEVGETEPLSESPPEPPAESAAAISTKPVDFVPVKKQVLTVEAPPKRLGPLNLERPKDWEVLATVPSEETRSSVFKRSSAAAILQRRQEQDAARALSRAQIARLGLPEEQFRRRTDAGEEVKTAKGCFIKRLEHGPSGMQERWWRTRCKDSRKPAWKREELNLGPDYRPEKPLADGKSDCPNGRCWAY